MNCFFSARCGKTRLIATVFLKPSSPALSALENPVYDIGVLDCKEDKGSPGSSTTN